MDSFAKVGIDWWGMLLYLVNFGILFALLGWLVIPKLTKLLDERRETIEGDLKSSAKLKEELAATLAESETKSREMRTELMLERNDLEREFKAQKDSLISEMADERNKMIEEARAQITEEKKRLISEVKTEIVQVMQKGVKTFLANADAKEVEASLPEAWKTVSKEK